jgi:hypothetical protein
MQAQEVSTDLVEVYDDLIHVQNEMNNLDLLDASTADAGTAGSPSRILNHEPYMRRSVLRYRRDAAAIVFGSIWGAVVATVTLFLVLAYLPMDFFI